MLEIDAVVRDVVDARVDEVRIAQRRDCEVMRQQRHNSAVCAAVVRCQLQAGKGTLKQYAPSFS